MKYMHGFVLKSVVKISIIFLPTFALYHIVPWTHELSYTVTGYWSIKVSTVYCDRQQLSIVLLHLLVYDLFRWRCLGIGLGIFYMPSRWSPTELQPFLSTYSNILHLSQQQLGWPAPHHHHHHWTQGFPVARCHQWDGQLGDLTRNTKGAQATLPMIWQNHFCHVPASLW